MTAGAVLQIAGLRKDYHALRPLRLTHLEVAAAETVALLGFDRAAAEVLVNLITGATLPDEGDITIFGGSTRNITSADLWFEALDRFGILSERVVLVDELTVRQNLTLPISLNVESPGGDVEARVSALAVEVGISDEDAAKPMGAAGAATKLRTRLGKALALDPALLLAEHPNAMVPPADAQLFARDLAGVAARRRMAMLVLTADSAFASAACHRVLTLQPGTGGLAASPMWRRWFGL